MGILHVTKKKVPDVLTRRLLQALKLRDNALLENLDGDLEKSFSEGKAERIYFNGKLIPPLPSLPSLSPFPPQRS